MSNLKTIVPIATILGYELTEKGVKTHKFNVELNTSLGGNALISTTFELLPAKQPKEGNGKITLGKLTLNLSGEIQFRGNDQDINLTLAQKSGLVNDLDGNPIETSSQLCQLAYEKMLTLNHRHNGYSYQPYYLLWRELLKDSNDQVVKLLELKNSEIKTHTPMTLLDSIESVLKAHTCSELEQVADYLKSQLHVESNCKVTAKVTK